MFYDKLTEAENSPFFREKVSYRLYSQSADEIYTEIEQPRTQGLLLFSMYKEISLPCKE